jgi:hypothetical protein
LGPEFLTKIKNNMDYIKFKDTVVEEYSKGRIAYLDSEGLKSAPLDAFIEQDTEGILYDLNRSEVVALTYIEDPKWVNDYAVAKVISALKNKIAELESKLSNS